ncbi:hypothetical protein [Aquabacterium sp.]|uniref:hypothetical protein n=1 Tax=Aquabacterium sp. TaxID=1872578 RepID=UPI002489848F|nr:hypothetical protein [Aquabacterium sp.]MDI1260517.1 hypothetical protein [Aquabacterium sp.]
MSIHRPTALAALLAASLTAGFSTAALAQSAYTMTVLGKPTGAYSFAPTTLDDQGVVRGAMYYKSGVKLTLPYFVFLPAYLYQAVSWSATTATAPATLGGKYLFPKLTNNSGWQVGPFNKTSELGSSVSPEVFPSGATIYGSSFRGANVFAPGSVGSTTMLRKGTVDTDLSALLATSLGNSSASGFKSRFAAKGMNNAGAIVGVFLRPVTLSDGAVGSVSTPLVFSNGTYNTLEVGPYQSLYPIDINDAGTVVGTVFRKSTVEANQTLPALWVNQRLTTVADVSLSRHAPLSINNAGQVLLVGDNGMSLTVSPLDFERQLRASSMVWANNSVTPLVSPNNDGVQATAMNDQGTVVGCILSAAGPQTVDARPFIWKNGVLQDLTQEWASKGVSLPAGTRWGCPLAINNSGSVVIYHYTSTLPNTFTWARINAKP